MDTNMRSGYGKGKGKGKGRGGNNQNFNSGFGGGAKKVCEYYSKYGNCKFGNKCRFQHTNPSQAQGGFGNNSSNPAFGNSAFGNSNFGGGGQQSFNSSPFGSFKGNKPNVGGKKKGNWIQKKQNSISNDLTDDLPQWPFTGYGTEAHAPSVYEGDFSPEELRWEAMKGFQSEGSLQGYIGQMSMLFTQLDGRKQQLLNEVRSGKYRVPKDGQFFSPLTQEGQQKQKQQQQQSSQFGGNQQGGLQQQSSPFGGNQQGGLQQQSSFGSPQQNPSPFGAPQNAFAQNHSPQQQVNSFGGNFGQQPQPQGLSPSGGIPQPLMPLNTSGISSGSASPWSGTSFNLGNIPETPPH